MTISGVRVTRWQTFSHALFLVLGFSLIFTIMGASVGLVGYALYDILPLIVRVGGTLLVVFGLRIARVKIVTWGWVLAALVIGALTYYLSKSQLPLPRLLDSVLVVVLTLTGLASFLSPCVLPLVLAYIGYLSGAGVSSVAPGVVE